MGVGVVILKEVDKGKAGLSIFNFKGGLGDVDMLNIDKLNKLFLLCHSSTKYLLRSSMIILTFNNTFHSLFQALSILLNAF